MPAATSVHDLRTLIRSAHPLIVIETVEEERVFALVQSVAAQERMPLFEWSITRGLTRCDDSQTINTLTAAPSALLQHLNGLTVEAISWLKDLTPHLQDAAYSRSRATCLLTGHPIPLRLDLEHIAVRFALQPPDRDELQVMFQSVLQSLGPNTSSRRCHRNYYARTGSTKYSLWTSRTPQNELPSGPFTWASASKTMPDWIRRSNKRWSPPSIARCTASNR